MSNAVERLHEVLATVSSGDPELARAYNNAGLEYRDAGETAKAAECFSKALSNLEGSEESPLLAAVLNNSGLAMFDAGNVKEASGFIERAFEMRRRVLDPDDPELGSSYVNMGFVRHLRMEIGKAEECYAEASRLLGDVESRETAALYDDIGVIRGEKGDMRGALESYLKALSILEHVLPPGHSDFARSFNNVGYAYLELGDRENALVYLRKARDAADALPSGNPLVRTIDANLKRAEKSGRGLFGFLRKS